MKTRKFWNFMAVALAALMMISCSADGKAPSTGEKLPPLESENGVRVSFTAHSGIRTRGVGSPSGIIFKPEDLRKDIDFTREPRRITPSYFFLDVSNTKVYEATDPERAEEGSKGFVDLTRRVGDESVNNVNMMSSKGMPTVPINNPEFWKKEWNSFGISEVPWLCPSNQVQDLDAYVVSSLVGVKLPEDIDISQVNNAMTAESIYRKYNIQLDDEMAWFQYSDLFPTVAHYLGYIVFQTGIETPYMINAGGLDGERTIGAFGGRGNFGGICLPLKEPLSFSGYRNPVVKIEYDIDDMVSLYPSDDGRWTPCLNMDDPFPFEIDCDEYSRDDEAYFEGDAVSSDVKDALPIGPLVVRRSGERQALQFIKPNFADIHHMEIRHASVNDESMSQIIYAGNENVYMHDTDVTKPHYYWAYTVDSYGMKSEGVPFVPYKTDDSVPDPDDGGNGDNGGNGSIPNGKLFMTASLSNASQPTDAGNIIRENLEKTGKIDFTSPVLKFTPVHFLTQIEEIRFYEPKDGADPMQGASRQHTYFVKDEYKGHMNMDLLDPATLIEFDLDPADENLRNHRWKGTGLKINGTYRVEMNNEELKGTPRGTLIGIPKTSVSEDVVFDNAVAQKWLDPAKGSILGEIKNDFIWFSLDQLVCPTGVFLDRILWHGGIESGTYHNPEKITGVYTVGCFTDTTDRSTALVKPKERLKLENPSNDTLVLAVNAEDMIWAYKTKDGKYHAVLNLDNPFPIQLEIKSSK